MSLRREVLQCFKSLHRARLLIFDGDEEALSTGRACINGEFKKNKNLSDKKAIANLVKYTKEVEKELRTSVIQAVEVEPGKYQARITPETVLMDNVSFKQCRNEKKKKN